MPKVQFYPVAINYKVNNNKALIYLFGRTKDGRQICVLDDFEPYFYVVLHNDNEVEKIKAEIEKIRIEKKEGVASITKTEIVTKNYLGKKVETIKVSCNLPSSEFEFREKLKDNPAVKNILEYDLSFVNRYLIDKDILPLTLTEADGDFINLKSRVSVMKAKEVKQISDEVINPKTLAFDIETYNPEGKGMMPHKNPVLMIAFYGSNFEKIITWKKFKTKLPIEFVKNEEELIEKFKEVIEDYKPDILTGYFSDGFDIPYLIERAKKYKIKLDIGLDYSEIKTSGRGSNSKITGIAHLDIFKFIRKIVSRNMATEQYNLDAVASELLGLKKKEIDLDKLAETWDNDGDIEKYCEYNLHDAKLTYMLVEKMLPHIFELIKIVGVPIFDITRMASSQLVESYLIRQTKNFNEMVPNKPHSNEIRQRHMESYRGAFVYKPEPGLYKDIVIFDFRSLYPTIIVSHNISLDTLNCECCKEKNKVPNESYYFCQNKKGFMSTVIEEIITRRMRINEMIKKDKENIFLNARSESLKVLANSFYGYFGFYAARWYSIECARSITAYGRYYITQVIDKAKKKEFNVIYSDTDSVFLTLDGKTEKEAIHFVEIINLELPGLMELEYEGFYPRGLFVSAKIGNYGAKKKYALYNEDGNLKIVGFETIRRNWSFIAKETQEKVLNIILKENNPEKAFKYVQGILTKLRKKEIATDKVVIFTQLQKNISDYDNIGPHVAVAKRMKAKGIDVGIGTLIKYVVVKGSEMIRERSRLPEEVEKGGYDADYYINNQVIPSVEKIFEVLGYNKEELIKEKDQNKLDKFF